MFTGTNLFSMFTVRWCAGLAVSCFCEKKWEEGAIITSLALFNLALVFI